MIPLSIPLAIPYLIPAAVPIPIPGPVPLTPAAHTLPYCSNERHPRSSTPTYSSLSSVPSLVSSLPERMLCLLYAFNCSRKDRRVSRIGSSTPVCRVRGPVRPPPRRRPGDRRGRRRPRRDRGARESALVTNPFLLSGELFEAVDRGVDVRPPSRRRTDRGPGAAHRVRPESPRGAPRTRRRVDPALARAPRGPPIHPVAEVGVVKRRKRLSSSSSNASGRQT